jgi:hypothetical protein
MLKLLINIHIIEWKEFYNNFSLVWDRIHNGFYEFLMKKRFFSYNDEVQSRPICHEMIKISFLFNNFQTQTQTSIISFWILNKLFKLSWISTSTIWKNKMYEFLTFLDIIKNLSVRKHENLDKYYCRISF